MLTPEAQKLLAAFQSSDDTPRTREGYLRIPFTFPGNKKESLNEILPRLPYYHTFVDVFGGSGVVTLNRQPCEIDIYNDRHSGVTAFFRCVRKKDTCQELIERCALSLYGREEFEWSRDQYDKIVNDDVELAACWYLTCQSSFAGCGRNYGRITQGKGKLWDKLQNNFHLFHDIAERFLTIQIENLDWRHCLKDFDSPSTVFYLDPPYPGHNIYRHQMTDADHIEMCQRIFSCQGFVGLSSYQNDIYPNFPWDNVHTWTVRDKMTTAATSSDTSGVGGHLTLGRKNLQTEFLYIKEAT